MQSVDILLDEVAASVQDRLRHSTVIDLTFGPLDERARTSLARSGANVVATSVSSNETLLRYRDDLLRAHAQTLHDALLTGPRARTLNVDGLNLAFITPFALKQVGISSYPLLGLRALWWTNHPDAAEMHAIVRNARNVRVWARSRLDARFFTTLLETGTEHSCSTGLPFVHPREDALARAGRAIRLLARGTAHTAVSVARAAGCYIRSSRTKVARPLRTTPDVVVSVDAGSWLEGAPPQHRYLTDVPRRLAEAGVALAWLPPVELTSLARFLAVVPRLDEPVSLEAVRAIPRAILPAARAAGLGQLRHSLASLKPAPPTPFLGVDIGGHIRQELDDLWTSRAFPYLLMSICHRDALERLRPAFIIYRNEFYPFGITLGSASRGLTRRIAFQHGAIGPDHFVYQHVGTLVAPNASLETTVHLPAPEHFLTYGPAVDEEITHLGYPATKVSAIGSLRHDALFVRARTSVAIRRASARANLSIPDGDRAVLVCGTLPQDLARWLRLLPTAMRSAFGSDCVLLVRPHWRFADQFSPDELRGVKFRVVLDAPLEPLIEASVALVTGPSTTALDAAILGTPPICEEFPNGRRRMPFVEEGLADVFFDVDSLSRALSRSASDEYLTTWRQRRSAYLGRHMVNALDPATDRLARLLRNRTFDAESNHKTLG